jgi:hypothetical protein
VVEEDRRRCYPRVSEACFSAATAFLQVFAELFAVHLDRGAKVRGFEGRSYGCVEDSAVQPLVEGRVRPGKVKRNVWNA